MDNNKKAYTATRAALVAQLDIAQAAVKLYDSMWEAATAASKGAVEDSLGDAWNAAHDAVSALEGELRILDREWDCRNIDSNTRRLVSENID